MLNACLLLIQKFTANTWLAFGKYDFSTMYVSVHNISHAVSESIPGNLKKILWEA